VGLLTLMLASPVQADRDFCRAWLASARGERLERIRSADLENYGAGALEDPCLASARTRVLALLDYECSNWSQLMDFEVRLLVAGVQERCIESEPDGEPEGEPPETDEPPIRPEAPESAEPENQARP